MRHHNTTERNIWTADVAHVKRESIFILGELTRYEQQQAVVLLGSSQWFYWSWAAPSVSTGTGQLPLALVVLGSSHWLYL